MASRRCMEKEISGNRRHNPDDELSPNISSLDRSEFEDFKGFQQSLLPNRPKTTTEVASHVDTAERVFKEQMIDSTVRQSIRAIANHTFHDTKSTTDGTTCGSQRPKQDNDY